MDQLENFTEQLMKIDVSESKKFELERKKTKE